MPILHLSQSIHNQLLEQAIDACPEEIVGILAGTNQSIEQILPLQNVAPIPEKEFVADPEGLLHALKHLRTQNLELLAFYHSHPNGPAIPSRTDLLQNKWDVPMLILDAKKKVIRAWHLETGTEIVLKIN